jgi:hypothetical protein
MTKEQIIKDIDDAIKFEKNDWSGGQGMVETNFREIHREFLKSIRAKILRME